MRTPLLLRQSPVLLNPRLFPSDGALQAHFDGLGGGHLEATKAGLYDKAKYLVANNQFTIPAADGGGSISWLRGVWSIGAAFRYSGFISDLDPSQDVATAPNYLANKQSSLNSWSYGAGATLTLTLSGGTVTAAAVDIGGSGYAVGNIIPANGGNDDCTLTVASVDTSGAILTLTVTTPGAGYTGTAATTLPAINRVGKTVVTLPRAIADSSQIQGYYCYRTGALTVKGDALSGYPNLHTSAEGKDYGSANDGDNYCAGALYYAWKVTGRPQYKTLADRILATQLIRGYGVGQVTTFDLPFDAQQGNSGIYNYFNGGATWVWGTAQTPDGLNLRALRVQATMPVATSSPYPSAGWGTWPSWPVTTQSPFLSYSFDFWGDGSLNQIQLSTNIADPAVDASNVVYGFCCLPADARVLRHFEVQLADFWQVANVIYNGDRTNTYSGASSSDGSATLATVVLDANGPSGYHGFLALECRVGSTSAYANFYFGSNNPAFDSSGATSLRMDLKSSVGQTVNVTITDAANASFTYALTATTTDTLVDIPISSFTPASGIVHPVKQISLQPQSNDCTLRVNNIRFAGAQDIVTLENTTQPVRLLNGFAFALQSYGAYDIYWKNNSINQTQQNPYPGISRYTYGWYKYGNFYGAGSWQGPIAPGYLWLLGWVLADTRFPQGTLARYADGSSFDYSGLPVAIAMRRFILDAQQAYATQFPSQVPGLSVTKFGPWGWESTGASGYVAGQLVPSAEHPYGILNNFYFDQDGDWYGYQFRVYVSCAEDYFVSGDYTAKKVLDTFVAWVAATFTYDAATKKVTLPATIGQDGTISNGRPIYGAACAAEALIYKYWRDGDATAALWATRLLDDIHTNYKITTLGAIGGIYVKSNGENYTYATATLSDPTGTGVTCTPYIAGGKITHIGIDGATPTGSTGGGGGTGTYPTGNTGGLHGTGYTSPTVTLTGDGTGAEAIAVLSDRLVGAYDPQHTGWEVAEVGKLLGMLVNGRTALATPLHTFSVPSYVAQDYADLWSFYEANTGADRPCIRQQEFLPLHEYTWSSYHWFANVENPVNYDSNQGSSRDTHTDGDIWTESIGPSLFYAVDRVQADADNRWLAQITQLLQDMGDTHLATPSPGVSNIQHLYDGGSADLGDVSSPPALYADMGVISGPFPFYPINLGA